MLILAYKYLKGDVEGLAKSQQTTRMCVLMFKGYAKVIFITV